MRSSAAPDVVAAGAVDDNVDGSAVVVAVVAACTCAPAAEPPRNMVTVVSVLLCFGERFVVDHENFEYIGDSQNGNVSSNRCRANVAMMIMIMMSFMHLACSLH